MISLYIVKPLKNMSNTDEKCCVNCKIIASILSNQNVNFESCKSSL